LPEGIFVIYRWIGAGSFTILSLVWMWVGGLPATSETNLIAACLLAILTIIGYRLGNHYEQLRIMAYHDSLTGALVNRRFVEKLQKEVEQARRNHYEVTLLFIDLDNFKRYNDQYGHIAGDQVLCQFTELLKRTVRKQDIVGRWGGEEFVVMLPQTSTDQGILVGERIQRNVREELAGVTVSIGLATFPNHAANAKELATKADTLMYEAKKQKDCLLTAT
jgi:diguanylate cyclase (GGDEF)-like protein